MIIRSRSIVVMPLRSTENKAKNNFDILSNIAEKILVNEDLEKTSEAILINLRKHLEVYGCGIVFPDDKKEYLQMYSYSNTPTIEYIIRFIQPTLFGLKFPIASKELLLSKCYRENIITQSHRIRDFFAPVINGTAMDIIGKTANLKLCMAIPVRVMGQPTGVLFAVFKKKPSSLEYSLFQFYANLSGLALNNHLKMKQLKLQFETEKTTTSMLSHELKTPIAIAHNSAQTVELYLGKIQSSLPPQIYRELSAKNKDIKDNIMRMARICNSIFSLREVETNVPMDMQKIRLTEQLEPVITNFERAARKKGLQLEINIKENPQNHFGGIVQLEQIITILLDNAIKYTDKGIVKLTITSKNKHIITTVTDSGRGVPKSERARIFDQFYRVHRGIKKPTEGLGLGLYIAKKIVTKLKGSISVDKNPSGQGTAFEIKIPIYAKRKDAGKATQGSPSKF